MKGKLKRKTYNQLLKKSTHFKVVERPKYGNRSTKCAASHYHASILEATECTNLYLLAKAKEIRSYEIQKPYDFYVNGIKICRHYVDFFVVPNTGRDYVIETKGMETDIWRIKERLFRALYPYIEYRIKKDNSKYYHSKSFK